MFVAQRKVYASLRKIVGGILGILFFMVPLVACNDAAPTVVPTPTPSTVQLVTLDLGIPQKALAAPVTGTVKDDQVLHVSVTFKINQAVLDQLGKNGIGNQGDSTNSADLANKIGITDEQYAKIKDFFGIQNATLKLGKLHTNLTIDAKAGLFAHLLQTRFVIHSLNGRSFYTPDPAMPPKVPGAIAAYIVAITGLDNYSLPPKRGFAGAQYAARSRHDADCNNDPQTLMPQQVAHAYGYDSFVQNGYLGQGMTVNLVEIDGFADSDVNNYFSCVSYKGKLNVVSMGGTRLDPGGESTLDIDMVSGLLPQANIVDYEVDINNNNSTTGDDWTRLNDAFQQIINDNADKTQAASVVSVSLGGSEGGITSSDIAALHESFKVLSQVEHMTVLVSSGDCGAYGDGTYNDLSVQYPSTDTYNVAVGGTVLQVDPQGNRTDETAWSDGSDTSQCQNAWGTGGGLSTLFERPSWQSANGVDNQYSNGKRQVPDISAVAYSLAVYYQGAWVSVGGTSAATPIWAAGVVLANDALLQQKQKFFYGPSIFYYLANHAAGKHPFQNITTGDNLYYKATSGWNYPTGLGTPNLVDFYDALLKAV